MKISKMISAVDSHTAGEAARIITGGILKFDGKTMSEKKENLEKHHDDLRKVLMYEPRGHNDMFGAFLCEPVNEEADYGIIFMDGGGYLNMCGHNTIAAMTAVVELGWVPVEEGSKEVTVVQDTPAGLVHGTVHLDDAYSVESVSFNNVASFLYKEDVTVEVPDFGPVTLDISFGGSFFGIVDTAKLDMEISPENTSKFVELGMKIRDAVNEQVEIQHPTLDHIKTVDLIEFYGDPKSSDATRQNIVIFGQGQADRSPCGTGTSAKLATLFAKGELKQGETFIYESVIGTKFKGEIAEVTNVGGYQAIIPRISGKAYITGFNNFLIDPRDALKDGFLLG